MTCIIRYCLSLYEAHILVEERSNEYVKLTNQTAFLRKCTKQYDGK